MSRATARLMCLRGEREKMDVCGYGLSYKFFTSVGIQCHILFNIIRIRGLGFSQTNCPLGEDYTSTADTQGYTNWEGKPEIDAESRCHFKTVRTECLSHKEI
jgi:hypothetical protein